MGLNSNVDGCELRYVLSLMSAPLVGDGDHPLLFQLKDIRAALALCQVGVLLDIAF